MKVNAVIVVGGLVQGVGFRFFASQKAREHGLTGYVKNLPAGGVEIEVEGEKGPLMEFIAEVRRGPRAARVTEVKVGWNEELKGYDNFQVRFW